MRHRFDPWVWKILWSKKCNPPQYSWVIYKTYWSIQTPIYRGVWQATAHGDTELDTTKQLNTHRHTMPLLILTLRYLNNTVSCSHCSILKFRSMGFPVGSVDKECRRCKRRGFDPWVWKIPWSWKWQPAPGFLPGRSHGQRRLVGCSPWGHKESDRTE